MSPSPRASGGRLWGLTAYFNPTGSVRRRENYYTFRRNLGVPLVAVELGYGPEFELGQDAADIVIRLRGRDVLWQKERLLNLALRALPADCHAVAWLDADIVFDRPDWPELTLQGLLRYPLVQPFRDVFDPGGAPSGIARPQAPASRHSLAYRVAAGALAPELIATAKLATEWRCAAGLAWAARREILDRHGIYDAAIIGGGDRAIACAAYGAWQGLEKLHCMNDRQLNHYLGWAQPFFATVRGRVGYVEGGISPLGHGSFSARRYGGRHAGLAPFDFDPFVDIAVDEQGCWRWNSDRPALHDYVRTYFERRED